MIFDFVKKYRQTILLVLVNILSFCIINLVDSEYFYFFSVWGFQTELFSPYQLITYQFLHANISHLFSNMWFLAYFGSALESNSKLNLFRYFVVIGIFSGLTHILLVTEELPLVGASGSVLGIGVLASLFSKSPVIKFIVCILVISDIFGVLFSNSNAISHFAHLGGSVSGFLIFYFNKTLKK